MKTSNIIFTLIVLGALLAAPPGWATTYYLCDAGTGCCGEAANNIDVAGFNALDLSSHTIYVCGTVHTTGTDTTCLELSASDSGTEEAYTIIRGDYPGHPGTISVDDTPNSYGIDFNDNGAQYFKFISITFDGNSGTLSNAGLGSETDYCVHFIEVDSCTFEDFYGSGRGIFLHGSNDAAGCFTTDVEVHDSTFTNIGSWGDTSGASFECKWCADIIFRDNVCTGDGSTYGVDCFTVNNGDGTSALRGGSGIEVYRNTCYGFEENCVDLKNTYPVTIGGTETGRSKIWGNDFSASGDMTTQGGAKQGLISLHFGVKSVDIFRNKMHDSQIGVEINLNETGNCDDPNASCIDAGDPWDCCTGEAAGDCDCTNGDVKIYENLFYGFRLHVYFDNADYGSNQILNNTFYDAGDEAAAGTNYGLRIHAPNFIIKGNIFKDLSKNITNYRELIFINETATGGVLDYNLYDKYETGTILVRCQLAGTPDCITDCSGEYCDKTELQSMGWETNAQGPNIDPLFSDAANGNFELKPSSPAIDAGVALWLVADWTGDYLGMAISGTKPDIGAHEYQQLLAGGGRDNFHLNMGFGTGGGTNLCATNDANCYVQP